MKACLSSLLQKLLGRSPFFSTGVGENELLILGSWLLWPCYTLGNVISEVLPPKHIAWAGPGHIGLTRWSPNRRLIWNLKLQVEILGNPILLTHPSGLPLTVQPTCLAHLMASIFPPTPPARITWQQAAAPPFNLHQSQQCLPAALAVLYSLTSKIIVT